MCTILAQRLALNDVSACFRAELIELDAALDVMDIRDATKFTEAKKQAQTNDAAHRVFVGEFKETRKEVSARAAGLRSGCTSQDQFASRSEGR